MDLRASQASETVVPAGGFQVLAERLDEQDDFRVGAMGNHKGRAVLQLLLVVVVTMNRLGQEPKLGAGVVRVPEFVGGETASQLAGLAEPLRLFGLWRRRIRNYPGLYLELLWL